MTIKQCLKKGLQSEVENIKRHSVLDIGFINKNGYDDETQIDIHDEYVNTKSGEKCIEEAFRSIASEIGATLNSVTNITVVYSADSEEEIYLAGY